MPSYDYRCRDCDHEFEIYQKFTDDALTVCPECDGDLRKVYSSAGVIFKGSGFYSTDSRAAATASTGPAAEASSTTASDSASSD